MTDTLGNTPLHSAVRHEQLHAISFLLDNGARSSQLNSHNMAPIHLAADQNKAAALKVRAKIVHPSCFHTLGCLANLCALWHKLTGFKKNINEFVSSGSEDTSTHNTSAVRTLSEGYIH